MDKAFGLKVNTEYQTKVKGSLFRNLVFIWNKKSMCYIMNYVNNNKLN